MSIGLTIPGCSSLHRMRPDLKLLGLAVAGTGLFLVPDWKPLAVCLAAVVAVYPAARLPPRVLLAQLRPVLWIVLLLLVSQVVLEGWRAGLAVSLRFVCLVLLASLLTLTTTVSDMIESLEAAFQPLRHVGLSPARVSFAVSMALRFIPVLSDVAAEVQEAQRARGVDGNPVAFAVPMILRTLAMADHVAEAIEARCYDPQAGRIE